LVTGGTGFVGRYLVRELNSRKYLCRLLIRSSSDISWLDGLKDIDLWEGDVTRAETLVGIAEDVDYVFHLAAEGHVSAISNEAYEKFVRVNVDGTKNLISECGKHNLTKFVHFSSTAAMGLIKKKVVDETNAPRPSTPYQKSKLRSEEAALNIGRNLGVPVVVLRPCMIYGVYGEGEFFKMSQLMRKGLFPRIGQGRNLTPLVHVKDVVQGAIKAAERGMPGDVYLLASENSIELTTMRNLVMEGWRGKAPYPYLPVWFVFFVAWCLEILGKLTGKPPIATRKNIDSTVWDRKFSIAKAKKELGYSPKVSFREGIIETVNWYNRM
jgi:nucleoside-diphosphate-sugar epimerase